MTRSGRHLRYPFRQGKWEGNGDGDRIFLCTPQFPPFPPISPHFSSGILLTTHTHTLQGPQKVGVWASCAMLPPCSHRTSQNSHTGIHFPPIFPTWAGLLAALPAHSRRRVIRGPASGLLSGASGTDWLLTTYRYPGRSLTEKEKKSVPEPVFPKKPAGTPCAQPWLVAVGGWRLAVGGGWQLATGGWWRLVVVGGGWRLVIGGWWRLAVVGSSRLVAAGGRRRLVAGCWWRLVVGGWWLVVGGWRLVAVGG